MTLPYDVARCPGRITHRPLGSIASVRVTSNLGHSECVRCRRREPGHPDHQMIAAQAAHIEKLQAKLTKTPSFAPQRVCEG